MGPVNGRQCLPGFHIFMDARDGDACACGQSIWGAGRPPKPGHVLPASCPKCGCESAGDPERVWKGPRYSAMYAGALLPKKMQPRDMREALHYSCLRCGYTIELPCLDAKVTAND